MKSFLQTDLPAAAIAGTVNERLAEKGCCIVCAPPGAGKSTLLPLTILGSLPEGSRILMLEPRRLAARQIALRMAELLGEEVGQTVGYRIRFERKVSDATRIEVLTEGILTRMLVDDPTLDGVGAVIFDEFHERSLASDLALALVREIRRQVRPDLRIVLMSATIDTQSLCQALDAPLVESEGRMFPVEIRRENEDADIVSVIRRAWKEEEGDILAFLPGEAEIRQCADRLGPPMEVYPLYGMLPPREQRLAIAPSAPGHRKIVLATPIAETSLTIEGVRIVVDGGLCRKSVFDPHSAMSRFETVRISRDMADQRTGRAGRVAPGICHRLWSAATEARMAPTRVPEILEADLASLVLEIAAWGENDPGNLPWLTPPPPAHVEQARTLLTLLGALEGNGRITPLGRAMAALPCHPRMARLLLQSRDGLAADMAALLEEKDPLGSPLAGLDLRVRALREARRNRKGWTRIRQIADQYRRMAGAEEDNSDPDPYAIGALLAAAYPERIAKALPDGLWQLAGGERAALDPADPLGSAEWIAVANLTTRRDGPGRIFLAAPVAPEDLKDYIRQRDIVAWDSREGAVVARREERIGSLLLASKPLSEGIRERQTAVICQAAVKEGLSMLDFSEEVRNLQRRIAAVAAWHPELELPDLSDEAVLAGAPNWLPPYVGKATTVAELKKIPLQDALWGLLTWPQQQAVEQAAPSHVTVPTGSRIRLEYRQGAEAPVLRVRLQECFGLTDTPRVDGGRRPVLMELLSPGYKPVQLTSDLRSFWENTYFEVRKELRRRYPKHAWPDNPLEADPVRGIRRKGPAFADKIQPIGKS